VRTLLVNPPLVPETPVFPPLGLCVLASALIDAKHEVQIFDLDLELQTRTRKAAEKALGKALAEFRPQVVGVTSMYSNSLQAARIIENVRKECPSAATVAGGPHFGALGSQSLSRIPELDYVLEGEAESGLIALLNALECGGRLSDVPSLWYREAGIVHKNQKGDLLNLQHAPLVFPRIGGCLNIERYVATIPPRMG